MRPAVTRQWLRMSLTRKTSSCAGFVRTAMRSSLRRPREAAALCEATTQILFFTMSKMADPEGSETQSLGVTPLPARSPSHPSPEWWSQTGSERRPPACKAGALPTELWPQHLTDPIWSNASPPEPIAKDHSPRPARPKHERQQSIHQAPIGWWARVDSNYRPHAYQACALTT